MDCPFCPALFGTERRPSRTQATAGKPVPAGIVDSPACLRQCVRSAPRAAQDDYRPGHMRTFVLRARAAPTDSQKLLASVGQEAHTEILAHTLMNSIFVAQSHRPDVTVHLVLESTRDFSRTIRFEANAMHDIGGFDERALLGKVARALDA